MLTRIIRSLLMDSVSLAATVLVIGTLLAAGCASDQSESAPPPVDSGWSAVPQEQEDAGSRPAVVFIEFVGTPQDVVDRMLKMAKVTKSDVVYDLGCGDGRILVTAAKRYGCRAVGYDLDPLRVKEARENARRHGVSHLVTVEQRDVLTADLRGATVVTIYLGEEINARLIPQLRRLQPGARIVSHDFGLANLPPDRAVEMASREDDYKHRIYLWRCPLPKDPQ